MLAIRSVSLIAELLPGASASLLYERFAVQMSGLSVVIASANMNFSAAATDTLLPLQVVREVRIDLAVESCVMLHMDHPRLRLDGTLPNLEVIASMENITALLNVASAFSESMRSQEQRTVLRRIPSTANVAAPLVTWRNADAPPDSPVIVAEEQTTPQLTDISLITLVQVQFRVQNVVGVLSRGQKVLVSASLQGLDVSYSQCQLDSRVTAGIDALIVKNCEAPEDRDIIIQAGAQSQRETSNALLRIGILQTSSDSARLQERELVLMDVSATIAPIRISIHPRVVATMAKFVADVLSHRMLASNTTVSTTPTTPTELNELQFKSDSSGSAPNVASRALVVHAQLTQLRLRAKAAGVEISLLSAAGDALGRIGVAGLSATVSIRAGLLDVAAGLNQFSVVSELASTAGDVVLRRESGTSDILRIAFQQFDRHASDYPGFDASIHLKAAALKVVLRTQFVAALVQWASAFPLAARIASGAAAGGGAAADAVVSRVQAPASLVKLDVDMRAPLVQIAGSDGEVFVTADLGWFRVQNEFGEFEHIKVLVSQIEVLVGTGPILDRLDCKIDVQRPKAPTVGVIKVVARIPILQLLVTPRQLKLVMLMLNDLTTALPAALAAPPPPELAGMEDVRPVIVVPALKKVPISPSRAATPLTRPRSAFPSAAPTPLVSAPIGEVGLYADVAIETLRANLIQDNGDRLAELQLTMLSARVDQKDSGALTVAAAMQSLSLIDQRPGERAFKEVLGLKVLDGDRDPLVVAMTRVPQQPMTVDIVLLQPTFVGNVGVGIAALEFFKPILHSASTNKIEVKSAPSTPRSAAAVLPGTAIVASSSPAGEIGMQLSARLDGATLILPADMTSLCGGAFILKFGASANIYSQGDSLNIAAKVQQLTLQSARRCRIEDASAILEPADIDFKLSASDATGRKISVDFGFLTLMYSYEDYRLTMLIVEKLQSDAALLNGPKVPNSAESRDLVVSAAPVLEVAFDAPPEITLAAPPNKDTIVLDLRKLSVIAVDDFGGRSNPLLVAELSDVHASVLGAADQATASVTLAMEYFNHDHLVWEPLIEPWSVQADIVREEGGALCVDVTSNSKLDISVTTTCIREVSSALSTWSADVNRPVTFAPAQAAVYSVRNVLGLPISVVLPFDLGDTTLADKQEVPFGAMQRTAQTYRERFVQSAPSTIRVDGFKPLLTDLHLNRAGLFQVVLVPEAEAEKAVVFLEPGMYQGTKRVTIRSRVRIINDTAQPVEFRAGASELSQLVAPGSDAFVPFAYARGPLHVRPQDSENKFARVKLNAGDQVAGSIGLRCAFYHITETQQPVWNVSLPVETAPIDVRLSAPIVVQNLLPGRLQYMLEGETIGLGKTQLRGVIEQGSKLEILELNPLRPVSISICTEATEPSNFVPLASKGASCRPKGFGHGATNSLLYIEFDSREQSGQRVVTMFAPYWIINRTGLPLVFRETGSPLGPGQETPQTLLDVPYMFSFARKPHLQIALATESGQQLWSKSAAVDKSGSVELQQGDGVLPIGFATAPGADEYHRTKCITLVTRHCCVNRTSSPVFVVQVGMEHSRHVLGVEQDGQAVISFPNSDEARLVRLRLAHSDWSVPIALSEPFATSMCFRLHEQVVAVARVEVLQQQARLCLIVTPEDVQYPRYRLENATNLPVLLCQREVDEFIEVAPSAQAMFGVDDPLHYANSVVLHVGERATIDVSLEPPKQIKGPEFIVIVRQDGPTLVVQIQETARRQFVSGMLPIVLSSSSAPDVTQVKISATMKGVGVSVVATTELLYLSVEDIAVGYQKSTQGDSAKISINVLQMDNMQQDAVFPVLLAAAPTKYRQPVLQCAFARRFAANVDYFMDLSVSLQPLDIKVDGRLVSKLWGFATTMLAGSSGGDGMPPFLPVPVSGSRPICSRLLSFSPLQLNVTIVFEGFPGLGLVPNFENVSLCVDRLVLKNFCLSHEALLTAIVQKYLHDRWSLLSNALHALLGVALFGDIPSFKRELFLGIRAIFRDWTGWIEFLRHLVHGCTGVTSRCVGTVGRGLLCLTADDEYILEHVTQMRKQPRGVVQGLVQGLTTFGKGVTAGVADLYRQPAAAVRKRGPRGIFVGVAVGAFGLMMKSATAAFDLLSKTLEGVRNSTLAEVPALRRRPPRTVTADGHLQRYVYEEAAGQELLNAAKAANSDLASDIYHSHLTCMHRDDVVVTDRHVFLLHHKYALLWTVRLDEIEEISIEGAKVVLLTADRQRISIQANDSEPNVGHDVGVLKEAIQQCAITARTRRAAKVGLIS
eukprot:TRINITY_DN2828_c0_g1_i1.p1 TRINITY_DN2828_c0_g1~~TRINITY_DN2828_c0_g1_i1.p1  ORF type:complete len:2279 (-),score=490.75 TRINITY_DN2828_c0_g1_i1:19-6855(-)